MHRPGHRRKGLDRLPRGDVQRALLVVLFSGGGGLGIAKDVANGGVCVTPGRLPARTKECGT